MQSVTLAIAICVSVLVVVLRPAHALALYLSAVMWYPDYLRVSIGTIDISAGRIIVTVFVFRCLLNTSIRTKFRWSRLDTLVATSMVVYVGVYLVTRPFSMAVENRGGFLLDTWFSYMAARFALNDREKVISFLKAIIPALVALAALGFVECTTAWQPFTPLRRFRPWDRMDVAAATVVRTRWGLARAIGPFSHSILFGNCLATFTPIVWALRQQGRRWRCAGLAVTAWLLAGALSSMSSGPWVMSGAVVSCLLLEKAKHWVKPLLTTLLVLAVAISLVSNRPIYQIIAAMANPLGGDSWQRVVLIDSAIKDLDKWFWLGYGGRDPGWGARVGMSFTDLNNEFIKAGVYYGIWGVIALCMVLFEAFRGLRRVHRNATTPLMKSLSWSFGTVLVGTMVAWMGVSYFGQMRIIFYILLGVIGSFTTMMFSRHASRTLTTSIRSPKNTPFSRFGDNQSAGRKTDSALIRW